MRWITMKMQQSRVNRYCGQSGVTLLELIIVITILTVLMGAAVPVVRLSVKRRRKPRSVVNYGDAAAIDRYKDTADRGAFRSRLAPKGTRPIWIPW